MFNNENCIGAFSGVIAGILVFALTAMAFLALDPPRQKSHAMNWEVSRSEPSAPAITLSAGRGGSR